jgi:ABC-type phosphate transport system substrate-binding protein
MNAEGINKETIAGAGPSTVIVQLFAKEFSQLADLKGYKFIVPPESSKHAGGIRNSDYHLFGRTGRPLNVKEKKMKKDEIFLARIPIAFATGSDTGVTSLTLEQLEGIYRHTITNWSEVGGADAEILLIGREPTEALFAVLKREYPFFKEVLFHQTVKKDDYMVNLLNNPEGKFAIGFGAKPNFKGLNVLDVKGFSSGVGVGLVFDMRNRRNSVVKSAIEFAKSKEWAEKVKTTGSLPPIDW